MILVTPFGPGSRHGTAILISWSNDALLCHRTDETCGAILLTFAVATSEQMRAPTGKFPGPEVGLLLSRPITFHVNGVTVSAAFARSARQNLRTTGRFVVPSGSILSSHDGRYSVLNAAKTWAMKRQSPGLVDSHSNQLPASTRAAASRLACSRESATAERCRCRRVVAFIDGA